MLEPISKYTRLNQNDTDKIKIETDLEENLSFPSEIKNDLIGIRILPGGKGQDLSNAHERIEVLLKENDILKNKQYL